MTIMQVKSLWNAAVWAAVMHGCQILNFYILYKYTRCQAQVKQSSSHNSHTVHRTAGTSAVHWSLIPQRRLTAGGVVSETPDVDGAVVGGGRKHGVPFRVPMHGVHCARVPLQLCQQLAGATVPHIHLRRTPRYRVASFRP